MPLSQTRQVAKAKHEINQFKAIDRSSILAFAPDNELVEILWKNGQIMMQSLSSEAGKNSSPATLDSLSSEVRHKDGANPITSKFGRYEGDAEFSLNGLPSSGKGGRVREDYTVPCLNFSVEDSLETEYCSDQLAERVGIYADAVPTEDGVVPIDRNRRCSHVTKDIDLVSSKNRPILEQGNVCKLRREDSPPRNRTYQLFALPQASVPNFESRLSVSRVDDQNPCGNPGQTMPISNPMPTLGRGTDADRVNFSRFSRPAAIVQGHLQSIDKLRVDERVVHSAARKNTKESSSAESTGVRNTERQVGEADSVLDKIDVQNSSTNSLKELALSHQPRAVYQDDLLAHNRSMSPDYIASRSSTLDASAAVRRVGTEKESEPIVVSSSVCSGGYSVGATSNDPKHGYKRKGCAMEESGYKSEDVEVESDDRRKPTTRWATGTKRSRIAKVHNLSERRRRDRINKKMRALQDLIPNCNKADKVSMLDEAIEYLKILQLQLQILSMRAGLGMPPLILPTGMTPMHPSHIPLFSPMGIGMGMGMSVGLGMRILDAARSSGNPLLAPLMHGPQSMRPANLHQVPGLSIPLFGLPPQGLTPVPLAPVAPFSGFISKVASIPAQLGASSCPVAFLSALSQDSKALYKT